MKSIQQKPKTPDMKSISNELVYRFPLREFSETELSYGLWIGMAYTTTTPQANGYERMRDRRFEFYSISHLFQGKGKIRFGKQKEQIVQPGDCIVVPPQVINRYGSFGDYLFLEDTIKFSGPVADMLFKAGIIKAGVYHLGMTRVLRPIVELLAMSSIKKRLEANILLQNILMKLYLFHSAEAEDVLMDNLLEMIENALDRNWSLEEMANLCQISKNQLRRNFLKRVGMTPKAYVDQQKINHAGELLLHSSQTVMEIAQQFGWSDPYHFSRRFKQITGLSPEKYRKQTIQDSFSASRYNTT